MALFRRLFLIVPFAIAAVLTVLVPNANRLRLRHVEGYGFLFATPWGWLIERIWLPDLHHHRIYLLFGYAILFWIPALLYSGSLWLLFRGLAELKNIRQRQPEDSARN